MVPSEPVARSFSPPQSGLILTTRSVSPPSGSASKAFKAEDYQPPLAGKSCEVKEAIIRTSGRGRSSGVHHSDQRQRSPSFGPAAEVDGCTKVSNEECPTDVVTQICTKVRKELGPKAAAKEVMRLTQLRCQEWIEDDEWAQVPAGVLPKKTSGHRFQPGCCRSRRST